MTNWVSGGACMSRSSLREGTSEVESDALFGKGSGSHSRFRRVSCRHSLGGGERRQWARELAEQAVSFEAFDFDRQHLPDDGLARHHMRGLKIGGTADDLAGIARGALEQHVDGGSNRGPVEGRLLAVDQFLKPRQSLVHLVRWHHLPHVRRRRAWPRRILERISGSVSDLCDESEGGAKIFLRLAGETDDKI